MPHISDYLTEKGNLSFAEEPFNEVDNYIIAKVGSPDLSQVLPEGERVPLGEALTAYFSLHGEGGSYLGALASPEINAALRRLPELRRYRDLLLSGYVRRILPVYTEQFSALTVTLPLGWSYVSFRGTDDTLLGWKENFLMSVGRVEAQTDAAAYLTAAAERLPGLGRPLLPPGEQAPFPQAVRRAGQRAPASFPPQARRQAGHARSPPQADRPYGARHASWEGRASISGNRAPRRRTC